MTIVLEPFSNSNSKELHWEIETVPRHLTLMWIQIPSNYFTDWAQTTLTSESQSDRRLLIYAKCFVLSTVRHSSQQKNHLTMISIHRWVHWTQTALTRDLFFLIHGATFILFHRRAHWTQTGLTTQRQIGDWRKAMRSFSTAFPWSRFLYVMYIVSYSSLESVCDRSQLLPNDPGFNMCKIWA